MTEPSPRKKILIVDDDPDISSALARGLALHGYETVVEDRPERALRAFSNTSVGAAIVDVMIGSDSGLDLVRNFRQAGETKPVLMLSALSTVDDRAAGLKAGADDYVVKPFSLDELVARLQVQEARAGEAAPLPIRLDPKTRMVEAGEMSVALTEREAGVLKILIDHAGQPVSRGEIFDALWSQDGTSSENVVDVYIGYLRRKLSPPEDWGVRIETIRSRGFVLNSIG